MKLLLENWRGYLTEIGTKLQEPLPFRLAEYTADSAEYYFETPDTTQYSVQFDFEERDPEARFVHSPDHWQVEYRVEIGERGWSYPSYKSTGENIPLRIMSTVVAIIKDFLKSDKSRGVRTFVFYGIPKGEESAADAASGTETQTQRTRIYKAFIQNQIPGAEIIDRTPNKIQFTVPEGVE